MACIQSVTHSEKICYSVKYTQEQISPGFKSKCKKKPKYRNCCCCLVTKSCRTLCDPLNYSPVRLLCSWDFPGKKLKWVAIPFSRRSSQPKDQIHVSCIGRWVAYHWATRESPNYNKTIYLITLSIWKKGIPFWTRCKIQIQKGKRLNMWHKV